MDIKRRLATAVATGALVFNTFAVPAFAGEIQISGNGAFSTNNANVNLSQNTTVVQNNSADITNNVDADADTGKNDALFNNGGDVTVQTGDASTDVNVTNQANANFADVDCCPSDDISVKISDNAAYSDNDADLNLKSNTTVTQYNDADVRNDVDADANTGKNDANYNNGGNVTIDTGKATTNVTLSTHANVNSATVGGDGGGSLSLWIVGNGAFSDNDINATLNSSTTVVQNNNADVDNNVDADAKTGKNDANFNNGGDVTILTGDATTNVEVDNAVNFNFADVDCGCLLEDWLAKIAGNAAYADSDIWLKLLSQRADVQYNDADLDNDLDGDAKTGKNDANYNNEGGEDGDPTIETGDSESNVDVENHANLNSSGSSSFPDLPDLPEIGVEFSLNWSLLLALLGLD